MKALSLQPPYAQLIVKRAYPDNPHRVLKPIENRPRRMPIAISDALPQRIYVHASLTLYPVSLREIKDNMKPSQWWRLRSGLRRIYEVWDFNRGDKGRLQETGLFGCIIGEVTITRQIWKDATMVRAMLLSGEGHGDPFDPPEAYDRWFTGPYGYILADPVQYDTPIAYRGQLGFFEVTLH